MTDPGLHFSTLQVRQSMCRPNNNKLLQPQDEVALRNGCRNETMCQVGKCLHVNYAITESDIFNFVAGSFGTCG